MIQLWNVVYSVFFKCVNRSFLLKKWIFTIDCIIFFNFVIKLEWQFLCYFFQICLSNRFNLFLYDADTTFSGFICHSISSRKVLFTLFVSYQFSSLFWVRICVTKRLRRIERVIKMLKKNNWVFVNIFEFL